MKKRVVSALIACLIIIPLFLIGGIPFRLLIGVISMLAYKEILTLKEHHKTLPVSIMAIGLVCLLCIVFMTYDSYALFLGFSYQAVSLTIMSLLIPSVFIKKNYDTKTAFYLIGFVILLGTLFNSILMINAYNKWLLLYIVLTVCITDIFAYLIGSLIGKHKISTISPKKSLEGCIAGSLMGTIIPSFYLMSILPVSPIYAIVTSLVLSIMGQLGDLIFSKIKRENDIKDFSNIMPGHGGILDRLDSLSFAMFAYIIISTLI